VDIGFQDDGKLLDFTFLDLVVEVFQAHLGGTGQFLLAELHQAVFGYHFRLFVVGDDDEIIPRIGHSGEPEHFHGHGGACHLKLLPDIAKDVAHAPRVDTAHINVAGPQGPFLNKDGGDGATALVQFGLNHAASSRLVGAGLQFHDLRLEQDQFEEFVNTRPLLGGYPDHRGIAPPFFRDQPLFGKLPLHPVNIGIGFVDLVDGDDNGDLCGFGVVDRLDGLLHYTVIRCHHQNDDIGHLGTTRPHGGESFMAGGIEEDHIAIGQSDIISADVLRDPARFPLDDLAVADCVEQ